jgi:hypothetical protein
MNSVPLKAHAVRYAETSDRLIKQNTSYVVFVYHTDCPLSGHTLPYGTLHTEEIQEVM